MFQDLSRRSIETVFLEIWDGDQTHSLNSDSDMFMYVCMFIDKYTDMLRFTYILMHGYLHACKDKVITRKL